MQHHGAPTSLLDFTASPYVAAYFALEDATKPDGHCAVWAVLRGWCSQTAGKLLLASDAVIAGAVDQLFQKASAPLKNDVPFRHYALGRAAAGGGFERFILAYKTPFVIPIEPDRLSERLTLQQGVFLCPVTVEQSFMDNLMSMGPEVRPDGPVMKLVIRNSVRPRALEKPRLMNITRATLFPGLDGYAQSFRHYLVKEPLQEKEKRMALLALSEVLTEPAPEAPKNPTRASRI